jgi:hypothetical protein
MENKNDWIEQEYKKIKQQELLKKFIKQVNNKGEKNGK